MTHLAVPVAARRIVLADTMLAALALLGGAMLALAAWVAGPLVVGALAAALVFVGVAARRLEVGLAAAFLLVPVSGAGVLPGPPWLLMLAWSAILAAWVLALPRRERLPTLLWLVAAQVLVAAGALVLVGDPEQGLDEVRSLATGLMLFVAGALAIRSRRAVVTVLAGLAASVALVGALAAAEHFGGLGATEGFFTSEGVLVSRAAAGFGHPNQLGGFLVLLLPWVVAGAVVSRRGRPLFVLAGALGLFGVYASFSRGSVLAAVVAPLAFLGVRRTLLLAPVAAGLLVAAAPDLLRERFTTVASGSAEVASRTDFWAVAVEVWQANPLLGVGPGGFPAAYAAAGLPERGFLPGTILDPPPHAHNLVLETLATQGILGLLVLGLVLSAAFRLAVRLRRDHQTWLRYVGAAALGSLLAFLVHNTVDVSLIEGTGTYFWGLLGVLAGASALGEGRATDGRT